MSLVTEIQRTVMSQYWNTCDAPRIGFVLIRLDVTALIDQLPSLRSRSVLLEPPMDAGDMFVNVHKYTVGCHQGMTCHAAGKKTKVYCERGMSGL